jgi:spore maturation protein CgeB
MMKIALFYHSLLSDWNHGNAHFLRGVATELRARKHEVRIFEPQGGWSLTNLLRDHGAEPIGEFHRRYPGLTSRFYKPENFDLQSALSDIDLVIVHEWTPIELVRRIAEHRSQRGGYCLLFHDTHHKSLTQPDAIPRAYLRAFDGVLAYGRSIQEIYLQRGWSRRAWVWHEAADIRIFRPLQREPEGDLVWIGNWGDEERTTELKEFLIAPVKALGLKAAVYGVRYPPDALAALAAANIEYRGWLANFRVPEVFARFRVTVHIPRRAYASDLPGIPTIRPFEAMACGIPLICSPWEDSERLFEAGDSYLTAGNGTMMRHLLCELLDQRERAQALATSAFRIILNRHTCAHRVDELLAIYRELVQDTKSTAAERLGAEA